VNLNALQLVARALTGAAKNVTLRADPAPAPTVESIAPVQDAARAPQAVITAGGAAAEALNAQVAARGGMLATVVSALGGNRYLISVDDAETPVVLNAAAVAGGGEFAPGTVVRLMPGQTALPGPVVARDSADEAMVSTAGKLLADTAVVTSDGRPRSPLEPASVAAQPAALVETPARPGQLAASIARAVIDSGLFYESHLAEWVGGRRSLAAMANEPQRRWAADTSAGPLRQAGVGPAADDAEAGAAPGSTASARTDVPPSPRQPDPAADAALAKLPADALSLVREQLQALSSQWLAWRGEVWPGQQAAIELGRDAIDAGTEAAQPWRAHIAVTLPQLGRVEVVLALTGNRLDLAVTAESKSGAERLARARSPLLERLHSHGLAPVARFQAAEPVTS